MASAHPPLLPDAAQQTDAGRTGQYHTPVHTIQSHDKGVSAVCELDKYHYCWVVLECSIHSKICFFVIFMIILCILLYLDLLISVCRFGEDSMEVMESLNFLFRKFHQLNISNEEYCCLKTIMFLNRGNTHEFTYYLSQYCCTVFLACLVQMHVM